MSGERKSGGEPPQNVGRKGAANDEINQDNIVTVPISKETQNFYDPDAGVPVIESDDLEEAPDTDSREVKNVPMEKLEGRVFVIVVDKNGVSKKYILDEKSKPIEVGKEMKLITRDEYGAEGDEYGTAKVGIIQEYDDGTYKIYLESVSRPGEISETFLEFSPEHNEQGFVSAIPESELHGTVAITKNGDEKKYALISGAQVKVGGYLNYYAETAAKEYRKMINDLKDNFDGTYTIFTSGTIYTARIEAETSFGSGKTENIFK